MARTSRSLVSHRNRNRPAPRPRPDQQVRDCPVGREGRQADSMGVPGVPSGSRSLPHPHDPDRASHRGAIGPGPMASGIQFDEQPRNRNTAYSRQMRFDMICEANGIEHRLTKPNHPCTNGQVERMNRTIKDATVKRFHYGSHDQLRSHLADFLNAYNFARRLKPLSGLTPTNTSAKSGLQNRTDSASIRPSRCRD